MLSAIVFAVYFVDNSAGNPYPSIGSKGKSKRLGNCAFLVYEFGMKALKTRSEISIFIAVAILCIIKPSIKL